MTIVPKKDILANGSQTVNNLKSHIVSCFFIFTARISQTCNYIDMNMKKHKAVCGTGVIEGRKVMLLKPQTFMNLSGESIREAVDFYKIDPETELIVIYDDISLAPGNLRIRKKGSAGGHNGMKNIILHLGTQVFSRIRVGVGEKPAGWDLADYVLGGFSKEDEALVKEACEHAAEAAAEILTDGPDKAMNDFN